MQRDNSMLTFEQSPFLGVANIVSKLQVRPDTNTAVAKKMGCSLYHWQNKGC